jgi:hypothetical protein
MKTYFDFSEYIAHSLTEILRVHKDDPNLIVNFYVDIQYIFGRYYLRCDREIKYSDKAPTTFTIYTLETAYREYITDNTPTEPSIDKALNKFFDCLSILHYISKEHKIKFKCDLISNYYKVEDEIKSEFSPYWESTWTYGACKKEAAKYDTVKDFFMESRSIAYRISRDNSWLSEFFPNEYSQPKQKKNLVNRK